MNRPYSFLAGAAGVLSAASSGNSRGSGSSAWISHQGCGVIEHSMSPTDRLRPPHHTPIQRLTEAGWNVIHGTHARVTATLLIAIAGLLATIAGTLIELYRR